MNFNTKNLKSQVQSFLHQSPVGRCQEAGLCYLSENLEMAKCNEKRFFNKKYFKYCRLSFFVCHNGHPVRRRTVKIMGLSIDTQGAHLYEASGHLIKAKQTQYWQN